MPAYVSYPQVLSKFGPQTDGGAPILGWVTQPFKLLQQDRAPPLRFTPATSAQLSEAVLASAARLTGAPPRRCQALLSSTVRVAFAVRSNTDLDSSEAMSALQEAFGGITGFFPGRIDVRLRSPSEVVREAAAAINGSSGLLRRAAARRMQQQRPSAPEFPAKQVLMVTFRDLAPSNASTLSDALVSRCGGAPSRCLGDVRAALRRRVGLTDGDEASLRVSMLARPQTELSVVLAVGLVNSSAHAKRAARERLRRWVQQRDVAEFLEQLTLLAAPVDGDDLGLPGTKRGQSPLTAAAMVWPGAGRRRRGPADAVAPAVLLPLQPWQSPPWVRPALLGPDAAHPGALLAPLVPFPEHGTAHNSGGGQASSKGDERQALADLEQQAAAAEALVAEVVKSLEADSTDDQQNKQAAAGGNGTDAGAGNTHSSSNAGDGSGSSQPGHAAIVGAAIGAALGAAAVVSAAVAMRHYQRRSASGRSGSAAQPPKPGPPSPIRTAPQRAASSEAGAGNGTPHSNGTRRPATVYHPKFVAQEAWANALARQHGLPTSEEVLEQRLRSSHSGSQPRSPQRLPRSPVRRPAGQPPQEPAANGAAAAPDTPTGSMQLLERGDSVSSAARLAFVEDGDGGSDDGGGREEADLELVVGPAGADAALPRTAPQQGSGGWRGLLAPFGRLLPWRGRGRGSVDESPSSPQLAEVAVVMGTAAAAEAGAAAETGAAAQAAAASALAGTLEGRTAAVRPSTGARVATSPIKMPVPDAEEAVAGGAQGSLGGDGGGGGGGAGPGVHRAVLAALAVRGGGDSPASSGSRGSPFASNYNFSALA